MQANKSLGTRLIRFLGYLFSIGLPLSATLSFFPLWRARGGMSVLAGGTLFIAVLCFLPLWRALKSYLRSPSVWSLWLFALLFFVLIGSIVSEMRVICLFGLIGNLLGALCFRIAQKRRDRHGA